MHQAVDDLGSRDSFHGYGPEQGYGFLRDAIAEKPATASAFLQQPATAKERGSKP